MTEEAKPVPVISMGSVTVQDLQARDEYMSVLLWGAAGSGKTTLASTFPGRKLWLQFDPSGTSVLKGRDDISVADFSDQASSYAEQFKHEDPYALSRVVEATGASTIVFDTLTTFQEAALHYGVKHAASTAQHRLATLEDPGFGGYGRRRAWVLSAVTNVLRVAQRLKKHVVFISHEDKPERDKDGHVLFISMMLGSDLANVNGLKVSEIWWMQDAGTEHRIAVRQCRQRQPMKSRMFDTEKSPEFIWKYNPISCSGMKVSDWYDQWKDNGYRKIPLPV